MKHVVRLGFAALLVLPGISCAQERRQSQDGNVLPDRPQAEQDHNRAQTPDRRSTRAPRRLETVTWNSVKHELQWVISKGEKKEGAGYKPLSNDSYEINMDTATMTFSGQTRKFSKEEATNVHALMDLISKYAVDSTIWWDQGHGDPVEGGKTVPVLRVSAQKGPVKPSLREIRLKIGELEQQLENLKRLEREIEKPAEPVRLTVGQVPDLP